MTTSPRRPSSSRILPTVLACSMLASAALARQESPPDTSPQGSPKAPPASGSSSPTTSGGASASAADSSQVASSGVFTPPTLDQIKRPAFGPAAGKPGAPVEVAAAPSVASRQAVYIFGVGAGLCVLATGGAALALARRRREDGSHAMAFTLGAKLALATGGLATLLVAAGAFNTISQASMDDADFVADNADAKAVMMSNLNAQMLQVRLENRGFRLKTTNDNLALYSDAIASVDAQIGAAAKAMIDPDSKALVDEVRQAEHDYAQLMEELVDMGDRCEAVLDQNDAAAGRIVTLVDELKRTLTEDARTAPPADALHRLSLVNRASEAEALLQRARVSYLKFRLSSSPETAAAARTAASQVITQFRALGADLPHPRQRAWAEEVAQAATLWNDNVAKIQTMQAQIDDIVQRNGKLGDKVSQIAQRAVTSMYQQGADAEKSAEQTASLAQTTSMAVAAVSLAVAGGVAFLLTSSLTRAAGRVRTMLQSVASNDLTVKPLNERRGDELGEIARASDAMAESLRKVIGEVAQGSQEVSAAATEIAASAEEMSAAVTEVAQQSTRAAGSAESSGRIASEGGAIVKSTVDRMREIETAVVESAASVTTLGKRGEEIGAVISVINDIADQTNLLALNAAIEAARAGEHGRGFAVVADEVRKLADRTTKATEEIGGSIKAIQEETSVAVQRMNRGTEQVRSGVQSAAQAGDSLEKIVAGASEVATMITSISAASEEAGAGAGQSASAASQLSRKAEQLRELVQKFKLS